MAARNTLDTILLTLSYKSNGVQKMSTKKNSTRKGAIQHEAKAEQSHPVHGMANYLLYTINGEVYNNALKLRPR